MILVINAGSSSLKFKLYEISKENNFNDICEGLAERIYVDGKFTIKFQDKKLTYDLDLPNHKEAVNFLTKKLIELKIIQSFDEIHGIGHRVVHGGEKFVQSTIITDDVMFELKKSICLAPLHNPPAIATIKAFQELLQVPAVVAFDTSFHATMPIENFLYASPYEWYTDYKVRRYGMHGISYRYVIKKIAKYLNKPVEKTNIIACHLGNGASVCAIKNGKSYITSMGITPLEGLIMGTRSGDLDPTLIDYMHQTTKMTIDEYVTALNKKSGLLGLSGLSSDLRDIEAAAAKGDKRCQLTIKMFVKRLCKYIAWYQNELENNVDAVVFTAGIGENSAIIRESVGKHLKTMDLEICPNRNKESYENILLISNDNAKIKTVAIRTNEELMICEDVFNLTMKK